MQVPSIRYTPAQLEKLSSFWGIKFGSLQDRYIPAGSPERTLDRVVIADRNDELFLLEKIAPQDLARKIKIIEVLRELSSFGMPYISEYLYASDGRPIVEFERNFWQLSPYIRGVQLDRLHYMYEGWRAECMSRFMIELKRAGDDLALCKDDIPFSLKNYIYKLIDKIRKHRPEIMADLEKVVWHLEQGLMEAYENIPVGFCHGDYHPLNIIWSEKDMLAVIDWEFMGLKPYIYDAANMIGCLGMEHPSSLKGDLVRGFVARIKAGDRLVPGIEWLIDFIIALRFAWLSEWLRKNDTDMVGMELDYMYLLINEREDLRKIWSL